MASFTKTTVQYKIVPMEGRECIQRNFIMFPEKVGQYNNRLLKLNQRFSVYERGFSCFFYF